MVHADVAHLVLTQGTGGGGGYGSYSFTYGLYYGSKDVLCGDVTITIEGDNLVITFNASDPWWLRETHVYIGAAPPSTHAPGRWPYKHSPITPILKSDSFYIPLADIPGSPGDTLYFAFHATIVQTGSSLTESATGWNPGNRIKFIINRNTSWKSYTTWVYPYPDSGNELWIEEDETAWGLDKDNDDVSKNEPGWFETFFNERNANWGWVCLYP